MKRWLSPSHAWCHEGVLDRRKSIVSKLTALEAADLDVNVENKMLFGAPQGFGMMNAIKTVERRVAKRVLLHCGGELMAWAVGNLKIERTATVIKATKQNAGYAKIDPAMALFNSATLMATNPASPTKPRYQMFFL